jgi:hypothetical protein
MQQGLCYYHTCMLLLAYWDLCSMCDGRERKEVKKQPGACQTWVKWLMRCIHLWWMIKTNLRLMESMQKWRNCQDSCIMQGVCQIQKRLLHHVDEEGYLFCLCNYSEKLVIAFGLINTSAGAPLWIFRNLRVCTFCNTSTKSNAKNSWEQL